MLAWNHVMRILTPIRDVERYQEKTTGITSKGPIVPRLLQTDKYVKEVCVRRTSGEMYRTSVEMYRTA